MDLRTIAGIPNGKPPGLEIHPTLEDALLEGLSEAPSSSPRDSGAADLASLFLPNDAAVETAAAPESTPDGIDADFETALLHGLSARPAVSGGDSEYGDPPLNLFEPEPRFARDEPVLETGLEFGNSLIEDLADDPWTSPDDKRSFDRPEASRWADLPEGPDIVPDGGDTAPIGDPEPPDSTGLRGFAAEFPGTEPEPAIPEPGDAIAPELDVDPGDASRGPASGWSAAALAFAADPATETALREALLHFDGVAAGGDDPQVWPGGLGAAVAAFADGHSSALVIVDIDGIAYPPGAIHELAEVCDVGTVVIAVGSNDTARFSREIMLAGVSEYLVKPLTPEAVREATGRVFASRADAPATGCVAGFAGTGGSGATTLAVATALHAAETGRYVSVLDLNRTVPVAALLLDVQPAAGLEQLIEVAGKAPPDPEMLNGVRAQRSERIAVYAYRWTPVLPAAPEIPALTRLLGELRSRSQLVLVDGMDDPRTQFALLPEVDVPVLVAEPTAGGAARAARILELLEGCPPAVAVQNHTRAFGTGAGLETAPEIVVPYLPSLPEIVDRGWPGDRLPRRLRRPVAGLLDRILASARVARGVPLREAA